MVGLLVRFSSILTTHGMTVAVAVEGKVRDLWREGWPSVHRPWPIRSKMGEVLGVLVAVGSQTLAVTDKGRER